MDNENNAVQTVSSEGDVSVAVEEPKTELRCPNCQALISEDIAFCSECGASLKKTCTNCGTVIAPDQSFCAGCGQAVAGNSAPVQAEPEISSNIAQYNETVTKKKSAKGVVIAIIAVVLVLALIGGSVGGFLLYKHAKDQERMTQVMEFTEELTSFTELVSSATEVFEATSKVWKVVEDSSYLLRNYMRTYARNQLSSYKSTIETANSTITDMYNGIMACDIDDDYVREAKAKAAQIYSAYTEVYRTVITNESSCSTYEISKITDNVTGLESIVTRIKNDYGPKIKK